MYVPQWSLRKIPRKRIWQKFFVTGAVLGLLAFVHNGAVAQAPEPEQSAHEFSRAVKDELVAVIRKREQLEQEGGQENYVSAVQSVLDPVVDFDYIARGVMGEFARQAAPEQRERFAEVFKQSLVNTYAKGLAGYGSYDITVVPPEGDVSGERTVGVTLNVSNSGETHRLAFTVKLNREGEWKVTNMILNGVNLGKAFRGQFANAMKQNNGDIDAVIANWTA
jgi:phospholipid transport system substrate-binding protein